jgi:hypothetical protein
MPHLLAQVRLERVSQLPEDVVINTFHFTAANVLPATLDEIVNRLGAFYTAIPPAGSAPVAGFMAQTLKTTGHTVRIYDATFTPSGGPLRTAALPTFVLSGSASSLPAEVALCLSFKTNSNLNGSVARRRGRVYIGPLSISAVVANAAGDSRPSTNFINNLVRAGLQLATSNGAAQWVVWSEVTNATSGPVSDLWVDDAWDTQRRRGADAVTRQTATTGV